MITKLFGNMGIYTTALTFNNRGDFEAYGNVVKNLKLENVALTLSDDPKITVLVETNLPIPSGLLIVKIRDRKDIREVTIMVSSGRGRQVSGRGRQVDQNNSSQEGKT